MRARGFAAVEKHAARARRELIVQHAFGGLSGVPRTEYAQVARRHRQLRGVVGDAVPMRGIAVHELEEPRYDRVRRTLRSHAMRRGVLSREDDERFVKPSPQEIHTVAAEVRQLAPHRREPGPHTAGSRRRQGERGASGVGLKVGEAPEKRIVAQKLPGEQVLEEEADAVEIRRFPSPDLTRPREDQYPGADRVPVRVERKPSGAARHQSDVEEPESVRLADDEAAQVVHPPDVDEQMPAVLPTVEGDSRDSR